jgi:hypothetical protein
VAILVLVRGSTGYGVLIKILIIVIGLWKCFLAKIYQQVDEILKNLPQHSSQPAKISAGYKNYSECKACGYHKIFAWRSTVFSPLAKHHENNPHKRISQKR